MLGQLTSRIDLKIESILNKDIFTNHLALARSILALCTLSTLVFNNPDTIFRPDGIGRPKNKNFIFDNFNFFHLLPYTHIEILIIIAILILLIVISGHFPKISSVLHFWICISFLNSAMMIEGGDQITSNLSLLLIPICVCDPRKNQWSRLSTIRIPNYFDERKLIANFFHFVIRIQISFIYFDAAIGKLFEKQWYNGTALYYWFNNPIFGMSKWMKNVSNPFIDNPYIIVFLTWGVLGFELLLFTALFLDEKYYTTLLWMGLAFHFLIILIFGLFSFFFAMAGALILYFSKMNKTITRISFINDRIDYHNIFHFITNKNKQHEKANIKNDVVRARCLNSNSINYCNSFV